METENTKRVALSRKGTIWYRETFTIPEDMEIEEFVDQALNGVIDPDFYGSEFVDDSFWEIDPSENDGYPTIVVYKDEYDFEELWDNVNKDLFADHRSDDNVQESDDTPKDKPQPAV